MYKYHLSYMWRKVQFNVSIAQQYERFYKKKIWYLIPGRNVTRFIIFLLSSVKKRVIPEINAIRILFLSAHRIFSKTLAPLNMF